MFNEVNLSYPYDQRSLVEELSPANIFEIYLKNKTLTFNRSETLNYIRAFWDDFIDSDFLDVPVENLFEQPEEFLLSQVCCISRKILVPLWERNLSKTECKEILTEMSLYELEEIVY